MKKLTVIVVLLLAGQMLLALGIKPQIKEGYVPVTGGKIYYKIVGDNKTQTPLITVHGGPGIPHNCLEVLNPIAKDRPVVYYDQLGCGKSDRITDNKLLKISRFVNRLGELIKYLGYKKIYLLGHSFGGALATKYTLEHPGIVKGLILVSPYISAAQWNFDQMQIIQKMPKKMRLAIILAEISAKKNSKEYKKALAFYLKNHISRMDKVPHCWVESKKTADFSIAEKMGGNDDFFSFAGELGKVEYVNELKNISCPVLFICGEYDPVSPNAIKFYASHVKNSKTAVISDASHMNFLEKPAKFNSIVINFLTHIVQ